MNSDHAPTAEEQLPPLDDSIVKSVDELSQHMRVQFAPILAVRYMVANNVLCGLEERERQLLAALRENREMKAQLAEARTLLAPKCDEETLCGAIRNLQHASQLNAEYAVAAETQCAEKDARIAELTRERDHTWTQRNADLFAERNAAEAKLRAVSDALDERPGSIPMEGHYVCFEDAVSEYIDGLRAIVEGK